jgi:hypothetical protein
VEKGKGIEDVAADLAFAAYQAVNEDPYLASYYPNYLSLNPEDFESVENYIASVYETLFGKGLAEDKEGIDGWANLVLTEGGSFYSLGKVIAGIDWAAEGIAEGEIPADPMTIEYAKTYQQRVQVAIEASQQFKTNDLDHDGKPDIEAFKEIVEKVAPPTGGSGEKSDSTDSGESGTETGGSSSTTSGETSSTGTSSTGTTTTSTSTSNSTSDNSSTSSGGTTSDSSSEESGTSSDSSDNTTGGDSSEDTSGTDGGEGSSDGTSDENSGGEESGDSSEEGEDSTTGGDSSGEESSEDSSTNSDTSSDGAEEESGDGTDGGEDSTGEGEENSEDGDSTTDDGKILVVANSGEIYGTPEDDQFDATELDSVEGNSILDPSTEDYDRLESKVTGEFGVEKVENVEEIDVTGENELVIDASKISGAYVVKATSQAGKVRIENVSKKSSPVYDIGDNDGVLVADPNGVGNQEIVEVKGEKDFTLIGSGGLDGFALEGGSGNVTLLDNGVKENQIERLIIDSDQPSLNLDFSHLTGAPIDFSSGEESFPEYGLFLENEGSQPMVVNFKNGEYDPEDELLHGDKVYKWILLEGDGDLILEDIDDPENEAPVFNGAIVEKGYGGGNLIVETGLDLTDPAVERYIEEGGTPYFYDLSNLRADKLVLKDGFNSDVDHTIYISEETPIEWDNSEWGNLFITPKESEEEEEEEEEENNPNLYNITLKKDVGVIGESRLEKYELGILALNFDGGTIQQLGTLNENGDIGEVQLEGDRAQIGEVLFYQASGELPFYSPGVWFLDGSQLQNGAELTLSNRGMGNPERDFFGGMTYLGGDGEDLITIDIDEGWGGDYHIETKGGDDVIKTSNWDDWEGWENNQHMGKIGATFIYAGYGNDTIDLEVGVGTDPFTTEVSKEREDYIYGGPGNDEITVRGDTENLPDPRDYENLKANINRIFGNGGDDSILLDKGVVTKLVDGGSGSDFIALKDGTLAEEVFGGDGDDYISIEGDVYFVGGGEGNDTVELEWDGLHPVWIDLSASASPEEEPAPDLRGEDENWDDPGVPTSEEGPAMEEVSLGLKPGVTPEDGAKIFIYGDSDNTLLSFSSVDEDLDLTAIENSKWGDYVEFNESPLKDYQDISSFAKICGEVTGAADITGGHLDDWLFLTTDETVTYHFIPNGGVDTFFDLHNDNLKLDVTQLLQNRDPDLTFVDNGEIEAKKDVTSFENLNSVLAEAIGPLTTTLKEGDDYIGILKGNENFKVDLEGVPGEEKNDTLLLYIHPSKDYFYGATLEAEDITLIGIGVDDTEEITTDDFIVG